MSGSKFRCLCCAASSLKPALDVDWDNPEAKAQALSTILQTLERVEAFAVNPAYTSQECSSCGAAVKKSLSMRTHVCKCGSVLDRDWNAAINILKLALSTTGHVGTWVIDPNALPRFTHHASQTGDSTATRVGAILLGQVGSMNEESSRL